MIDWIVKKWDKNKDKLKEYYRTHKQEEYDSYKKILSMTINIILNDGDYKEHEKICTDSNNFWAEFDNDDDCIKIIDFGNYSGTLIFVFCEDSYQPSSSETFYTMVEYGSCSGCDTLLGINDYETDKLPSIDQVNDYMELSLHLIQNIKQFKEGE